jgi:O-antigen/teichoic acid export membrane protein
MEKTAKNLIYQLIYQLLTLFIPLITGPIVSRALGASGVGTYNFAYSVVTYFCIFSALGISNLGTREIGFCKSDKTLRTKTFWNIYYIKLFFGIIAVIAYLFVFLINHNFDNLLYFGFLFHLLGSISDISWLFFGVGNFKVTVLKNSIIKIISLVLIVLFVKAETDLYLYVFIVAGSEFLSNIVLWLNARKYISVSKFNFGDSKIYLKPAFVLFLPAIASSLYVYMDKIILGIFSGDAEVGYYSSMEKIVSIPFTVASAVGTVFYSRSVSLLSNKEDKKNDDLFNKTLSIIMMVTIPCCVGLFSISEVFVPIYFGEGYEPVIQLIQIGVIYLLFRCLRSVVKTQIMLPNKMDKLYNIAILSGGLSNLILNLIFIPFLGAIGAVIATIFSDFISTTICVIGTRKHFKPKSILRDLIIAIIASAAMYVVVRFEITYFNLKPIIALIVEIISGAGVYLIIALIVGLAVYRGKIKEFFKA